MRRPGEHAQRNARNLFRHRCAPFCFPAAAQLLFNLSVSPYVVWQATRALQSGLPQVAVAVALYLECSPTHGNGMFAYGPVPRIFAFRACSSPLLEHTPRKGQYCHMSHRRLPLAAPNEHRDVLGAVHGPRNVPGTSQEHPGVHLELQVGVCGGRRGSIVVHSRNMFQQRF
mgnify:CR=1 FL=1